MDISTYLTAQSRSTTGSLTHSNVHSTSPVHMLG